MFFADESLKRGAPNDLLAEPPPKVARHAPAPTKQHSIQRPNHPRACRPNVKHGSHPNARSGTSFHYVPYPLDLLPYPSWYALHHHHLTQISTNVQIVCPVCAKTRSAPPHHQKLFLVAERLLFDPQSTPLAVREKTEALNWKVNYKLGILDPAVEEPGVVLGGLHSQTHFYYPFASEFEMRAALKLLEKATVMSERAWKVWLDMVDHLPTENLPAGPPSSQELIRQVQRQSQPQGIPQLPTPPSSSPTVPLTSSKNANSLKTATANLEVEELDMTGDAVQQLSPVKRVDPKALTQPAIPSETEFQKSRNIKLRTLPDLYQLLDMIERTSYCSARFLEAYAEFLRDDLCSECWVRHNVLSGDTVVASPSHLKQTSDTPLHEHGRPPSKNKTAPSHRSEHAAVGGYHKYKLPPSQWPKWKRQGLNSTFRGR